METWDAIRSRRAVRSFTDQPVDEQDLDRILEAGRRAPSSMNEQRWDFVVVTSRDRLRQLSKVWRYGRHVASSAATVALVTPHGDDAHERESIAFDLGQAVMSMMIAAADLGIGSCHSSVHDQELARSLLSYPDDRRCDYLVALGYPADRPLKPLGRHQRRPFDDVIHHDRW
ncbi:MAG TPA: nitroreductase [Actinomycetota bacterium]|jgi:nitroreductase